MKNTKDSKTLLDELKTLLDVRKNLIGTDQINNVIADKAEEFVETLYTEIDDEVKKTFEPSATPKSEMPCNCHEEKVELKPCPFCGSKDLEIIPAGKGDNESMSMYQRIYCSGCQTMFKQMIDASPEYLVQCWNTRNAEVAKADSVPYLQKKNLQGKIIQAVTDSVKKNLPPDVNLTIFTVN